MPVDSWDFWSCVYLSIQWIRCVCQPRKVMAFMWGSWFCPGVIAVWNNIKNTVMEFNIVDAHKGRVKSTRTFRPSLDQWFSSGMVGKVASRRVHQLSSVAIWCRFVCGFLWSFGVIASAWICCSIFGIWAPPAANWARLAQIFDEAFEAFASLISGTKVAWWPLLVLVLGVADWYIMVAVIDLGVEGLTAVMSKYLTLRESAAISKWAGHKKRTMLSLVLFWWVIAPPDWTSSLESGHLFNPGPVHFSFVAGSLFIWYCMCYFPLIFINFWFLNDFLSW